MESDRVSLQGSSRRMTSGRRSALLVVDREHLHNTSAFVGFDVAARHEALSREDGQAVVAERDLPGDVLPAPSRLSRWGMILKNSGPGRGGAACWRE